MKEIDFKLKLLAGQPINTNGYGEIKPLTMREIINFGYSEYMQCLNMICLEKEDLFSSDSTILQEIADVSILDILLLYGGDEIEQSLINALQLFLRGEVTLDKDNLSLIVRDENDNYSIVNRTNFNEIKEILKWINYVNSFNEKTYDNFNPANEEARKLKEQQDALKRQVEAIKRKQNNEDVDEDEAPDIYDIMSAVASKSNSVNELNILDLTIYQIYTKFKRLEIIDQYDISIKSIMAGASNVKLKHWSTKGK